MLLLMDTCAWSHSEILETEHIFDIRPFLGKFRVGATEEILKELKYYRLHIFVSLQDLFLVPLSSSEWEQALQKYPTLEALDKADQSLVIAALRDKSLLVTDDGDLFLESQALGVDIFRLPAFLLKLARQVNLSKTTVYKCLRFWEERGSYKKRDISRWKTDLQSIT